MSSGYIQDPLDLDIKEEPPPHLIGVNEWPRAKYGSKKDEVGYSTGKWSDDDDIWNPITPFFGRSK